MDERAIRGGKSIFAFQACATAAVVVVGLQEQAHGCIGSRLIWHFTLNLVFLNLFIGALEGFVGFVLFRVRFWRAAGIMILANYFSLIAGYPLLGVATGALEPVVFSPPRILYLRNLVLLTIGVSLVLTVFFEMPFSLWLFKGKAKRWRKAVLFAVVSQLVTYAFLGPMMRDWVSTSVYDAELAADTSSMRNPGALVYYLDNDSGDLWRVRLDGSGRRFVARTTASEEGTFLFPVADSETGAWKLMAVAPWPQWDEYALDIPEPLEWEAMDARKSVYAGCYDELHSGGPLAFDFADPLSNGTHSHRVQGRSKHAWDVVVNKENRTGYSLRDEEYRLFYQTPFRFFLWGVPSVLPGDEAVVSVDGQILLLDLAARRLSFLVEGRSPFVVLPCETAVSGNTPEGAVEDATGT